MGLKLKLSVKFAICIYLLGLITANILANKFGPIITPVCGFFFIGLDLSLRDWLHVKIRPWQMGTLILVAGLLTFTLDKSASRIAVASSISFAVAALVDWFIFANVKGSWFKKSVSSNFGGGLVDSILFPSIAFGSLMPLIILGQFAAKLLGSLLWAIVINKFRVSK